MTCYYLSLDNNNLKHGPREVRPVAAAHLTATQDRVEAWDGAGAVNAPTSGWQKKALNVQCKYARVVRTP